MTDDNPRSEVRRDPRRDPGGCPEAIEVGDRAEAILRGVDALGPGDALLIAGKGHETGQVVGDVSFPSTMPNRPALRWPRWTDGWHERLWTSAAAAAATGGRATAGFAATGRVDRQPHLAPGDLFVALADARDGHDFVADALRRGAAAAMVSRVPDGVAAGAPLCGRRRAGRAARAGPGGRGRAGARVMAVTGLGRQDLDQGDAALRAAAQGRVHAAEKSYNNHWGVPLTLARMPADTDFAVIEIGMNHPGEIAPLARWPGPTR